MVKSAYQPIQPFTVEVSASELPDSVVALLPRRPPADARFTITVEPAQSDAERLEALRRDIQEGLADIEAGRVHDMDDVFDRLDARLALRG